MAGVTVTSREAVSRSEGTFVFGISVSRVLLLPFQNLLVQAYDLSLKFTLLICH
jgi:hypothetical protein